MKAILITLVCLAIAGSQAHAATKVVFQDKAGQTITLETAMQISAKGETVYRCQPVKATVNKSGTSVTFKVVK